MSIHAGLAAMSIQTGLLFLFPNMEFYLLPQLKYHLFFRLRITKLLKSIVKLFFSFFPPGAPRCGRPYNIRLTCFYGLSAMSALKRVLEHIFFKWIYYHYSTICLSRI